MARKPTPLSVFMNNRRTGWLTEETSGAVEFRYDPAWLSWEYAIPVSLSLPLREERYIGSIVTDIFDNLLPDNRNIRRHIAERTGAGGVDAFSLLQAIGRDCVGALQFVSGDRDPGDATAVKSDPISDKEIEKILLNLKHAPLGIGGRTDFRISIAGVQEKTALLRRAGQWEMPQGVTATTHILKPAIGILENGLDLSQSVENEHFCLTFLQELGLQAAKSEIAKFGKTRVLVVERFDRVWSGGRLIRRPQEDMCQALSVPWTRKYESDGGPGIQRIMTRLGGSDEAQADKKRFLTTQIAFWLLGATDGHAKNFSIYLSPGERFSLTPLYDVLSAQPNVDTKQIQTKAFKLAMAVGNNRHYGVNDIATRHYYQMAEKTEFSKVDLAGIFAQLLSNAPPALERTLALMPKGFPARIAESIAAGVTRRLRALD